MNIETRNILNIIKSGITEEKIELSKDISFDKLKELTNKHCIFTLIYYALNKCGVTLDDNLNKRLSKLVISEIYVSEQQLYYIKKIESMFESNNIDYMLLKGSILKKLYPKPEIRRMGDIDILIKEEQYQEIAEIMEKLGFVFEYESNHELVWKKDSIMIELHKILVPSYNKDLHKYFGNGWKRAVKAGKNSYTFSEDDMLIYLFSHFAKHYRDSGIGIIHMCDLYLFLSSKAINEEYVRKELTALKLYDFYCNVKRTLEAWFEDSENDEMTDYITTVIFNSGVYGLSENVIISSALKEKKKIDNVVLGKIHRVAEKIFPPYRSMKKRYQILKKYPILLPVFWMIRLCDFVFLRRKEISKNLNDICVVNEKQIHEYEASLKYVGLNYNFK